MIAMEVIGDDWVDVSGVEWKFFEMWGCIWYSMEGQAFVVAIRSLRCPTLIQSGA